MDSKNIKTSRSISVAKALVAAVPYVGGTISSFWSDLQAERKEARFERFIETLGQDLTSLRDQINREYISKSDFLDIFEITAQAIIHERTEEKREGFKNILVSGIIDPEIDYDRTEAYLKLLNNISLRELVLLKIYKDPVEYNLHARNPIKNPNDNNEGSVYSVTYNSVKSVLEVLRELLPKWSIDDILEATHQLYFHRLSNLENIENSKLQTTGNPIHVLDNRLTEKGKNFIEYITVV